jgi:hypothetical protein
MKRMLLSILLLLPLSNLKAQNFGGFKSILGMPPDSAIQKENFWIDVNQEIKVTFVSAEYLGENGLHLYMRIKPTP